MHALYSLNKRTIAQETSKVLETHSQNLEQYSKRQIRMTDGTLAQGMIREAFPRDLHGGYKGAVYAAYRFISTRVKKKFTERRAAAIWNGEARRIDMEEAAALEEALVKEAINETERLRSRLAALDAKIAAFSEATARQALAKSGRRADGLE